MARQLIDVRLVRGRDGVWRAKSTDVRAVHVVTDDVIMVRGEVVAVVVELVVELEDERR